MDPAANTTSGSAGASTASTTSASTVMPGVVCVAEACETLTGALRGILFSEFDVIIGPRPVFQAPSGSFPERLFSLVKEILIPKPALCHRVTVIKLAQADLQLVGFAVNVTGEQYARNALLYNLAFVFRASAYVQPYKRLVEKFAYFIRTLEVESRLLSTPASKALLPRVLLDVYTALRAAGECRVAVTPSAQLSLKLVLPRAPPPTVSDWHVPVLVRTLDAERVRAWSLELRHVVPLVNGLNHVRRIAEFADSAPALVREAIEHLLYHGYVALTDVFQFGNVYTVTSRVGVLTDPRVAAAFAAFVCADVTSSRVAMPTAAQLVSLYGLMVPPLTVRDLCAHPAFEATGLSAHRFVLFGVVHGVLRRLHRYLLRVEPTSSNAPSSAATAAASAAAVAAAAAAAAAAPAVASAAAPGGVDKDDSEPGVLTRAQMDALGAYADGTHCWDEICCALECSSAALEAAVAKGYINWME